MFLNLCSFTVQLVRVKSEAGQDRSKLFGVSYTKKKKKLPECSWDFLWVFFPETLPLV